jgi:hypothetical protein
MSSRVGVGPLTKLADAAFKQAARKVIEDAETSGTPVIDCVKCELQAVPPQPLVNRTNGQGKVELIGNAAIRP